MTTATTRQRVLDAAVDMTIKSGWAVVTMSKLADHAGVSRQTVYNEVGSKPALAEAMIAQELDRSLSVVSAAFEQHPDDVLAAIASATAAVLELSQNNTLLHAVVSATHGADTELLPLLTTSAGELLATAKIVLTDLIRPYRVALSETELLNVTDLVVRAVLSHMMQPSATPRETGESLAWVVGRIVGQTAEPTVAISSAHRDTR